MIRDVVIARLGLATIALCRYSCFHLLVLVFFVFVTTPEVDSALSDRYVSILHGKGWIQEAQMSWMDPPRPLASLFAVDTTASGLFADFDDEDKHCSPWPSQSLWQPT